MLLAHHTSIDILLVCVFCSVRAIQQFIEYIVLLCCFIDINSMSSSHQQDDDSTSHWSAIIYQVHERREIHA